MGVFSIRQGGLKLIIDCDNSGDGGRGIDGNRGTRPNAEMQSQLYNLDDDPFESYNRIRRDRDKAGQLRRIADRQRQ